MSETTWDRHPTDGDKARIWRRDDGVIDCTYPWFYYLPFRGFGSIARTWEDARDAVRDEYARRWYAGWQPKRYP